MEASIVQSTFGSLSMWHFTISDVDRSTTLLQQSHAGRYSRRCMAHYAESNAQGASNLLWALSTMRHRPSEEFANRMQHVLLSQIKAAPETVHPQNIGDMIQALAVLRLPLVDGLAAECEAWVAKNIEVLLPNHILAYLNVRGPLSMRFIGTCLQPRAHSVSFAEPQSWFSASQLGGHCLRHTDFALQNFRVSSSACT